MTDEVQPDAVTVLRSILSAAETGAIDGAALMRAITFGGTIKVLRDCQANAGPATAAIIADARVKLVAADKGPAPMETNRQMTERKILRSSHTFALAKSSCQRDSNGNMVHLSGADGEIVAEHALNEIEAFAGRLSTAAHVDALGQ